jgi:pilus assembly protein CpaE
VLALQHGGHAAHGAHHTPSHAAPPAHHSTALLDLGLPARDGLLYLGLQSGFNFVDGVHNLQRLDLTLLQTALAQHAQGPFVLPLPGNLHQMREVSHAQSGMLIQRLTDFFDLQIADLGGFTTPDFVAQIARTADTVWVVCDQSLGGIVSTASLLRELQEREVPLASLSLVVNRFDSAVNLPAADIARQLGLPLAHVLPARSTALLAAASQGELLVRAVPRDAYSTAVGALARELTAQLPLQGRAAASAGHWAKHVPHWLGRWSGKE